MKQLDDLTSWIIRRKKIHEKRKEVSIDNSRKMREGAKAKVFKEVLNYIETHFPTEEGNGFDFMAKPNEY